MITPDVVAHYKISLHVIALNPKNAKNLKDTKKFWKKNFYAEKRANTIIKNIPTNKKKSKIMITNKIPKNLQTNF